jgi:hypothetical protein
MGADCYICNKTKLIIVSCNDSRWKNSNFCDCHEVMHRYHWDINDEIYTGGGVVPFKLCHRTITNTMVPVATNYNKIYPNNKSIKWAKKLIFFDNTPTNSNYQNIQNSSTMHEYTLGDIPLDKLESIFDGEKLESIFDGEKSDPNEIDDSDNSDHAPIWNNNKCIICEYVYHKSNVTADISIPNKKK